MSRTFNVKQEIGVLQQCLSNDKKPIGFFIGAGCPMSILKDDKPLIPGIVGITDTVCSSLSATDDCKETIVILHDLLKKDLLKEPNIEDLLSFIRFMKIIAGDEEVRGLNKVQLDRLEELICNEITRIVDVSHLDDRSPYHKLSLWIDAIKRNKQVEIYTINYDLLMEQALEDQRIPFFDGFSGVKNPFFDLRSIESSTTLPNYWVRFWKIHGSINWYQEDEKGVIRSNNASSDKFKRVIHPSHLKYEESRRMPYLAMIDRFKTFLKEPTVTLIICGYSFNDQHLNEIIVDGLQGNQTAICFALFRGDLSKYKNAVELAKRRSNLIILAKNGGIIGSQEFVWDCKDTTGIEKWINSKDKEDGEEKEIEFLLGNFKIFGDFLHDIIGSDILGKETNDE